MLVSPTHVSTGEAQNGIKKKFKRHGNRKLQHFKRKCRTRGLNEEEIAILIQRRNHTISERLSNDQTVTGQIKPSNKRKRDQSKQDTLLNSSIKSMSQLSISQETTCKKMKNSTNETMLSDKNNSNQSNHDNFTLYKPSKYLKMPRKLLLHSLRLQLNYPLKKQKEQCFILSRLQIFDQQFCLNQIRYLYQTYFDQGFKFQIWPVITQNKLFYLYILLYWTLLKDDILQIIQSNSYSVIQKYLEDYIILLQNKIDQYSIELTTQSSTCPSTLSPCLQIINQKLKEFVRLHHIDLLRTINYQVNKLKDNIYEKQLFKQLSCYDMTTEQFEIINLLITIRKKQLKLFEDLTMFEQRILCHKLLKSFDSIKVDVNQEQYVNKRNKIVQELKRRMLNVELEHYEIKMQHYELLYEQDFTTFQKQILNPSSSDQECQVDMIMYCLKLYLNHHTNRLIRQIRYKESCLHVKLIRHYRRHSLSEKKIINVYPQIIVDVPKISLNYIQLDYLSHNGPNYIRPNQSYLKSYKYREKQIEKEYNSILDVIIPYLERVYHIPNTSTIIKQFSQQLATSLYERYMAPLSYLNIYRAQKEFKLMKSIQSSLKKGKYILRVTDKSDIFHIGHTTDYAQKAEAYIELTRDPLWTVFDKVAHLLNDLRSKKQILV